MSPLFFICKTCGELAHRDDKGTLQHRNPASIHQPLADEDHAAVPTYRLPEATVDTTGQQIPKFITVIHVRDADQALINTERALAAGAGGVCLIQHNQDHALLMASCIYVRAHHPSAWVGLNFLGVTPLMGLSCARQVGASALWFDHFERSSTDPRGRTSRMVLKQMTPEERGIPLMGGVDFKYGPAPQDVMLDLECAASELDVVMTSGAATGSPADVEKVVSFANKLSTCEPPAPLGLASGISILNVHQYHPYVKHFMVASSISKDFHNLDKSRVAELANELDRLDRKEHSA